jgi:hypothetical protein
MADERERTIFEVITGTILGALGVEGVHEITKALGRRVQAAATKKADELTDDHGERTDIMIDVAEMMISKDQKTREAGEQIRKWFIRAHDDHVEGDITNLFRKFPAEKSAKRKTVFRVLGGLPSYEDFMATVITFLHHDNLLQEALKIAERMRNTGGNILDEDLRAIHHVVSTSLRNSVSVADTAAGAVRPSIQNLTAALRRIR